MCQSRHCIEGKNIGKANAVYLSCELPERSAVEGKVLVKISFATTVLVLEIGTATRELILLTELVRQ